MQGPCLTSLEKVFKSHLRKVKVCFLPAKVNDFIIANCRSLHSRVFNPHLLIIPASENQKAHENTWNFMEIGKSELFHEVVGLCRRGKLKGEWSSFAHKQILVVFFPILLGISGVALNRKGMIKVIKTRYAKSGCSMMNIICVFRVRLLPVWI